MRERFSCPKLFAQVVLKVCSCIPCQIFAGEQKLVALPLILILVESPFLPWGLDFIGETIPSSSNKHRWIVTTVDYFTKWVEAIHVRNAFDFVVMNFIEENVLSRFGCPRQMATNNSQTSSSIKMI